MRKIDLGLEAIHNNISSLRCPYCFEKFIDPIVGNTLRCSKNHCFDISTKGYINFLNSKINDHYSKESFAKRRETFNMGFFKPVYDEIISMIQNKGNVILDAGCGEGSGLNFILNSLNDPFKYKGIGMDISKNGILLSTDYVNKNFLPIVGDLSHIPFKDGYFSFIINFLSPANYKEFSRVLKNDGILIKILPEEGYLREIREYFYKNTKTEIYSNQNVIENLLKNFIIDGEKEIIYKCKTNSEYLEKIMSMTPLSWNISQEQCHNFLNIDNKKITCHFKIIWGHSLY